MFMTILHNITELLMYMCVTFHSIRLAVWLLRLWICAPVRKCRRPGRRWRHRAQYWNLFTAKISQTILIV